MGIPYGHVPKWVNDYFNPRQDDSGSGPKKAPAKGVKKPKAASSGPRASSKTAQLIGMLRRPEGATLEEIMARFGWQVHTTRALMSAGGSLTKKHGITVISERVGDARTYRIRPVAQKGERAERRRIAAQRTENRN